MLGRLEEVLQQLQQGALTAEQTHHVTYQAMPRLVSMLLKLPCSELGVFDRLNEFNQCILRTTVALLRSTEIWELVECSTRVLTEGGGAYLYHRQAMRADSPNNLDEID